MAIQYSVTHRTNAMTTLNNDIGASCVIKIFDGTLPATCATPDAGTTLVTFAGNAAGFGTVASGVLTANSVSNANAAATGTASYFRIYPTAATTTNAVVQGTCGTANADMILTSLTINSGQVIQFTSMTITAFGA